MPRVIARWFVAVVIIFVSAMQVFASERLPFSVDTLSKISLPTPKNQRLRNYLGLSDDNFFFIRQIKAEIILIEVFSMYCPYCQQEAPLVNELYQTIEKDPHLRGRIKIIGIGAGNTPFEVDIFQKNYQIPFPLFSDEDFSLHKALGEVRTPYFIGLRINKDKSLYVFYSELGSIKDPHKFLKLILALSGMKEE